MNSQSVAVALRYFSGVQIKDNGGLDGLKTINIRSMGSQHVGVFYDGIQLGIYILKTVTDKAVYQQKVIKNNTIVDRNLVNLVLVSFGQIFII